MTMRPRFLPAAAAVAVLALACAVDSVCVPRNTNPIPYLYASAPADAPQPATPKSSAPAPESESESESGSSPLEKIAKAVGSAIAGANGSDALKAVCAYTDYPDLCVSSIESVAPSLDGIDVASAAALQIKALGAKVQGAMEAARKFAAEATDKELAECLRSCVDNYDDGMDNLDAAKNALLARDRGTAASMLSAAYGAFNCADTFGDDILGNSCKKPSPTAEQDGVLTKLTSNSLAICEHLDF